MINITANIKYNIHVDSFNNSDDEPKKIYDIENKPYVTDLLAVIDLIVKNHLIMVMNSKKFPISKKI